MEAKKKSRSLPAVAWRFLRLHAALKRRGVSILFFEPPFAERIKGLSDFERERIDSWEIDLNDVSQDLDKLAQIFGPEAGREYIAALYEGGVVVEGAGGRRVLDQTGPYVNIVNGRRITVAQPADFHNRIHTCGTCLVRGTGVEDKDTLASLLQSMLNEKYPNAYQVQNDGIGRGTPLWDDMAQLMRTPLRPGDAVLFCNYPFRGMRRLCKLINVPYISLSPLFDRPHDYGEWFSDLPIHTNAAGNRVIAGAMARAMETRGLLHAEDPHPGAAYFTLREEKTPFAADAALQGYLESLAPYADPAAKTRGAIVMNCNPFTLGHRYLIEQSARKVDRLYIFVVEEDKSFFPFADRLALVRAGTADIPNVTVLGSGGFIISAVTFPGYFLKDNADAARVDCAGDVEVFGRCIAPRLGITRRFAGEEPLDPVTRKYNETMKEVLPPLGVMFEVIPRTEQGGAPISASRVRRCIQEKDFSDIRALVPQTTYDYLVKRFGGEENA